MSIDSGFDNPIKNSMEAGNPTTTLSTELLPLEAPGFQRQRNERFWNMLVTTIPRAGFTPPSDRSTTILDVGSGRCDEGRVLNAYFGGNDFGKHSDSVRLIGVDINEKALSAARANYGQFPNYEFHNVDGTRLDEDARIPQQVDVAVIRHQEIGSHTNSDPERWPRIFQQTLDHLTPEGIGMITTYWDYEHGLLLEALQKLDCDIVVDEMNNFTDEPDKKISGDRYVTVIRKKQKYAEDDHVSDKPVSAETERSQFRIKAYEPSDLTDELVKQLKLKDLVAADLTTQDPAKIEKILHSLRNSPRLYIAQSELDGSAVGSIASEPWDTGTQWGDAFWGQVRATDPQFSLPESLRASIISSVQTLPDWQKKGVQKKLWETLISKENPHVLLGESKNPIAVKSRLTAAERDGYRTFFELNEVKSTDNEPLLTDAEMRRLIAVEASFVVLAAQYHFGTLMEGEGLLTSLPEDTVFASPNVPDINGFPSSIKNAFEHLRSVQQRVNSESPQNPVTVLGPLVSVREDVLSGVSTK